VLHAGEKNLEKPAEVSRSPVAALDDRQSPPYSGLVEHVAVDVDENIG
jgi:hypothetical protein